MVRVWAPATSANLGCGYDVFGIALGGPADIVTVERADRTTISVSGWGSEYIPTNPAKNTAGIVAEELDAPVHIDIDKGVRPSSGMGSSAASAAGAALAINEEYDLGLSRRELVSVAAEGEAVVSGEAHEDNVAPALLGGFTIVADNGITQVDASIPVVACLPDLVVSTRDARSVVPTSAPLSAIVDTVGGAATLTAGMFRDDPVLVGKGMEDEIVTPARAKLIEGYEAVKTAALDSGAEGVTVSGAGPALLAVCQASAQRRVAMAMVDAFEERDIDARVFQTHVSAGAQVF